MNRKPSTTLVTTGGGRAVLNSLRQLRQSPSIGLALRKVDFSLRLEGAPDKVSTVEEYGIAKLEMGMGKRHVPDLEERKRARDQHKQLSF
jgi:hypothetical protein